MIGQGRITLEGHVARMGINPEVKVPLGRSRYRWEDNTKWILEKQVAGMDWIHLAQDRDTW
jgi:hypothetical protein